MAEQHSTKFLAGFFFVLGLLLFSIVLYDFIGNGKINYKAIFIGLVMFYFASRSRKKETK